MTKNKKKTEMVTVKPEFSLIDENLLKSRIYTIRGVKVMLDADLAEIYGYSTSRFNEQVKYNLDRFDEDFRFQLTREESTNLISEIPISRWGGTRKPPYAFTEQGIYMLMTVLKGEQAVAQSKALIRLFKRLKDYAVSEGLLLHGSEVTPLALQTAQNTRDIADVSADVKVLSGEVHEMRGEFSKMNMNLQKVMENFVDPSTHKHFLILNGQRLEADIAYTQIYGMAKKSITIIDDYIGVKTLDLLRQIEKGVSVTIYSDNRSFEALTKQMQKDFLAVRPDVKLAMNKTKDKFHDRYIFLDYGLKSEKLFHCGASSKDAGNKITTIMQIEQSQAYHCIMEMLMKK
ncbi:ORF6N domain-containing protein [Fibrobacter sp. UWCM]|uniref:ORF6N domain-containing protein n=1 Tax=Fibrobacter sp. UWCM TaxID=1896208 RepID=UPI0009200AD2|nr:ORF6N domain-containing protein [Fibrobacter sp. UWCM]SHG70139.1 ORF6N domain-containing protein [Fibrobacter sp. UWCM]